MGQRGRPRKHENGEPGSRSGRRISLDVDPELIATLDLFRASQRIPPPKTDVLEVALREFLKREGFSPGPRPGDPPQVGAPAPHKPPVHLTPIAPTKVRLPILGSVPAGPPVEMFEEPDEWLDFGERFTGEGRYGYRVKGRSMADDGVLPGDVVVLTDDPDPPTGEVVVAVVNGAVTLKKLLRKTPKEVRLISCDGTKTMYVLDPARGDRLLGVLVGVVRYR